MLRRNNDKCLDRFPNLKVNGKRQQPKKIWKRVANETEKIGLKTGKCPESSDVARLSVNDCNRKGVNAVNSV